MPNNRLPPRDQARLLVYHRLTGDITHARVSDLPSFLPPETSLVVNNSRVRHSRLYCQINSKKGELLILSPVESNVYRCLLRGHRLTPPAQLTLFSDSTYQEVLPFTAELIAKEPGVSMTTFLVRFSVPPEECERYFEKYGHPPLPPYITQPTTDPSRYQTVFARPLGSAAAPTAGLHFTPKLINQLSQQGFGWEEVTLHVGLGTFLPLREERIEANQLHREDTFIAPEVATRLNHRHQTQQPILAVGTTSARTLESHFVERKLQSGWQATNLFIYPGYRFQVVKALLTNFHLPRSSLLLLVTALLGNHPETGQLFLSPEEMRERWYALYQVAIQERYRFYSFGDAMLIL